MDIHQLRTFLVVAREGSITRASQALHLSQPAVSAHIKAMEEVLGLSLFQRTARGMSLTLDGQRLLSKAEQTLAAYQGLMDEASRTRGQLSGRLVIGAGTSSNNEAIGKLLTGLSARHPDVAIALKHGSSREILDAIRNASLDAGFYSDVSDPEQDLIALEVSSFHVYVAAAPGLVPASPHPDWQLLSQLAWIYPGASACCGKTAESIFKLHRFRPQRIVSVDRQEVSRALIAGGVGIGLLHADVAEVAERSGEVEILFQADTLVRIYFAHLATRREDPLLVAATSMLCAPGA